MPHTMIDRTTGEEARHMTCLEVWGGNDAVDAAVTLPGLDAWVYSRPFEGATSGGDVHYVSSCGTGRITRLLVADVSGHGEDVAETARELRTLMRRFVNHIDQTKFVASMNHHFTELSEDGRFATALVTTFFAPTSQLSLCNAGHPSPLHWKKSTGRWSYIEREASSNPDPTSTSIDDGPANIPLGILDLDDYGQFDIQVDVGDLVLCYTDSLVEARDVSTGELLGQTGLLKLLETLDPSDPTKLAERLLASIEHCAAGEKCQDDVTVLLFRPNGSASVATLRERVVASFKMAASVFGRDGPIPWPELSIRNLGGALLTPLSRWRGRRG